MLLDTPRPTAVSEAALDNSSAIDRRRWSSSIMACAGFAALAVFYSFWVAGWIAKGPYWEAPGDSWMIVDGARFVWHGALPYVYQGTQSYALPGSFIVFAPVAGIIDHFHLIEGAPRPVQYPSAWPVFLGYSLALCVLPLYAARALAWDMGIRRRLWLVQALTAVTLLASIYYWGHFEDALALTFVIHCLRRLLKEDYVKAAIFLSVAVAFKQDVVTLIPLLVLMAPGRQRIRVAVASCALPAALVLLCLSLDWSDAHRSLFSPINLVSHYEGHSLFYVTWLGAKTSQYSRSLGVLVCVALGWVFRRVRGPVQILGAVSVILLVRPMAEAINYSYYWAPGLLMAGLIGVAAHGRVRPRDWIWPILALAWATPRGTGTFQPWWWAGETILLVLTAAQTAINCGIDVRLPAGLGQLIKKIAQPPIKTDMNAPLGAGETTWNQ